MPEPRKKYDSTVARIAGNIMSGLVTGRMPVSEDDIHSFAFTAVHLARAIVAEVERTDPEAQRAQALREMHQAEQRAGNLNENAIRHPQDTDH